MLTTFLNSANAAGAPRLDITNEELNTAVYNALHSAPATSTAGFIRSFYSALNGSGLVSPQIFCVQGTGAMFQLSGIPTAVAEVKSKMLRTAPYSKIVDSDDLTNVLTLIVKDVHTKLVAAEAKKSDGRTNEERGRDQYKIHEQITGVGSELSKRLAPDKVGLLSKQVAELGHYETQISIKQVRLGVVHQQTDVMRLQIKAEDDRAGMRMLDAEVGPPRDSLDALHRCRALTLGMSAAAAVKVKDDLNLPGDAGTRYPHSSGVRIAGTPAAFAKFQEKIEEAGHGLGAKEARRRPPPAPARPSPASRTRSHLTARAAPPQFTILADRALTYLTNEMAKHRQHLVRAPPPPADTRPRPAMRGR